MHRIIQIATQLQKSEEQNAQTLRALAGQVRDSNVASQLRTLESKERSAANQLRQIVSELNQTNIAGTAANPAPGSGSAGTHWSSHPDLIGIEKTDWAE